VKRGREGDGGGALSSCPMGGDERCFFRVKEEVPGE
jgi:hypothetical protein